LTKAQVEAAYPWRGAATRLAIGPVVLLLLASAVGILLFRVLERINPDWSIGL
jgi:hypothetical protein